MNMKFMKTNCKQVGAFPLTILLALVTCSSAFSQDNQNSDFLTDYSQLQRSSDQYMGDSYLVDCLSGV